MESRTQPFACISLPIRDTSGNQQAYLHSDLPPPFLLLPSLFLVVMVITQIIVTRDFIEEMKWE